MNQQTAEALVREIDRTVESEQARSRNHRSLAPAYVKAVDLTGERGGWRVRAGILSPVGIYRLEVQSHPDGGFLLWQNNPGAEVEVVDTITQAAYSVWTNCVQALQFEAAAGQ